MLDQKDFLKDFRSVYTDILCLGPMELKPKNIGYKPGPPWI